MSRCGLSSRIGQFFRPLFVGEVNELVCLSSRIGQYFRPLFVGEVNESVWFVIQDRTQQILDKWGSRLEEKGVMVVVSGHDDDTPRGGQLCSLFLLFPHSPPPPPPLPTPNPLPLAYFFLLLFFFPAAECMFCVIEMECHVNLSYILRIHRISCGAKLSFEVLICVTFEICIMSLSYCL